MAALGYSSYDDDGDGMGAGGIFRRKGAKSAAARSEQVKAYEAAAAARNASVAALTSEQAPATAARLGLSAKQIEELGVEGIERIKENQLRASMITEGGRVLRREAEKRDADERSRGMEIADAVQLLHKDVPAVKQAAEIVGRMGSNTEAQAKAMQQLYLGVADAVQTGDPAEVTKRIVDLREAAQAMDIVRYPEIAAQRANSDAEAEAQAQALGASAPLTSAQGPTPEMAGASPGVDPALLAAFESAGTEKRGALGRPGRTAGPYEDMTDRLLFGPAGIVPQSLFFREGQSLTPEPMPEGAQNTVIAGAQPPVPGGNGSVGVPPEMQQNGLGPLAGGAHVDTSAGRPLSFSTLPNGQIVQAPGAQAPAPLPQASATGAPEGFMGPPASQAQAQAQGAQQPSSPLAAPSAFASPTEVAPTRPSGPTPFMQTAGAVGDRLSTSMMSVHDRISDLAKTGMDHLSRLGGSTSMPSAAPAPTPAPTQNIPQISQDGSMPRMGGRQQEAIARAQQLRAAGADPNSIFQSLSQEFPDLVIPPPGGMQ